MNKLKITKWGIALTTLLIIASTFFSCGSYASMSTGQEPESYIIVSADKIYKDKKVDVRVDDLNTFEVKAVAPRHIVRKGERIVVHPGSHDVVVKDKEGKILFNKTIFVSARFSKLIELP